jgi:hypothetical protein
MNKIKAALVGLYSNVVVREDLKDLVKVIVAVLLAHFGLKYS